MNETGYTALQGKVCVVTLEGVAGTDYQWCLTSMPKELALFGTDRDAARTDVFGGTYREHFYFLVKGSEETTVKLNFELTCISNPAEVSKTYTVEIRIIPANSSSFASLDTVAQVRNMDADALLKYGYACGAQDDEKLLMYGLPCAIRDDQRRVKYGYPCGVQESRNLVKYGYPCGVQESQNLVKYGYPCGVQESQNLVKYGYPCGVQDGQNLVKYGYPLDQ